MKKKILLRGILGLPIGIAIGYVITILTSLVWGQGYYSPCIPELIDMTGSEINAVLLQTALCGLLGISFGASSVIWDIENWSIIKQTGIYFLITAVVMMPVAYLLYWMEHSIKGFLGYLGIFAAIFIVIWLVLYLNGKHSVKKMNSRLN